MRDISGRLDERFQPVADAFLQGFEEGRDVGASLAVFIDGAPVIDVWHGHVDRAGTIPWREDTLVCMFSVTKAMAAVCLLQAVARGQVELDAPVADCWPEFAGQGKTGITLRHLLSHRAGLVGFHQPVDRDILYDWDRVTAALAAETPWWNPGEKHGYHARTFGFLVGEVLRRRTGRSIGEWFRAEVAEPLGLDFAIGLPERDLARCAEMLPARLRPGVKQDLPPGTREMLRRFGDASTATGAAFQNPSMGAGYMNSAKFRRAEIPAANGHGTARAAAGMYDRLATLLEADVLAEATSTQSIGPDEVLRSTTHFGLGFMLHHDDTPVGLRSGSFGHAGAGGSMAFRDPAAGISFCFAMNQMEMGVITGGASATRCATALYDCL
ncbi:MAG: serine hydrolase domain-containing protein [Pseudomonadales bacterium]